jgi:hypothetical protein
MFSSSTFDDLTPPWLADPTMLPPTPMIQSPARIAPFQGLLLPPMRANGSCLPVAASTASEPFPA